MIQGTHNPFSCSPNQKPIHECTLVAYGMLEAELHLHPQEFGFWRYAVSNTGIYRYFKNKRGESIIITEKDLQSGFVEIWVTNGIAEKVILYQGVKDIVYVNVESIIGRDSLTLFIDSSAGDFLDADNLNTTFVPTVMRYFKDFTTEVVSWQWFRESGTTQEDRDADEIWALDKNQPILELTPEDFTQNIHSGGVTFMCQALVNNEMITAKIEI